jgi:hypothetical protein
MIFAPSELALVDIDGLVRTAHLLRAALHVHQQCLQNGPQSAVVLGVKRCASLDKLSRYAAHDVLCEEHNLLESEVTLLKP